MKINAVKCKKCGDTIFSRATHDFHYCSCKSTAIDGGLEYTRIIGKLEDTADVGLDLPYTPKELFDDWDKEIDKLGVIKDDGQKHT